MGNAILRDILIIAFAAVPVVLVAHRLRFPSIVGFLVTGFLIGPHVLALVPDVEEIRVLAEVGVALLLFSIGLEFSFERLKGWGRQIVGMGALQVLATAGAGYAAGLAIGQSRTESAFLGCAIALSSTAVVLAILSQKRWFDAPAGRIATGILILQDLAVIPMMVVLKLLFFPGDGAGGSQAVLDAALKIGALFAAIILLYRWLLAPLLRSISRPRSKELFVVVVVGLAIGASYVTELLGLSFALGAFLAGLIVSTTDYRFHALSEIAPFRSCFNGLFFVTVGMMVNPLYISHHWAEVLALVAFILAAKAFIVGGAVLAFGSPVSVAVISALMLAQVGEFSFMLTFFGWKGGAISYDFSQLIVDAAAITMVAAPFVVLVAPRLGEKLAFITWRFRLLRGRWQGFAPDEEERLEKHAIICGFGPLGMAVGKILDRHGIPYVVLELNPLTAENIRKKGGRAYVGDGASAALLHHSGVERARMLAIAVPDQLGAIAILQQARRMNPELFIVTRSRYRDGCLALYEAGADVVICEELEGGIEMGRYILAELGVEPAEVAKIFEEIRSFGSADFF